MKKEFQRLIKLLSLISILLAIISQAVSGQKPTPTPPEGDRGIGVQGGTPANSSQPGQAREAKPELVLQTGYSTFGGATRPVFSPDGRVLATATFPNSTNKLLE